MAKTQFSQRFLGFANYYRKFIRSFSTIVAPLTVLTKKGADPSAWSSEAISAFETLKEAFISAPILRHPNIELPFVLEVDASDCGAGAVLSQRPTPQDKLHPCAYFSKKFSSAERNYDVGNRELLAVKMALQEWRHLLEGSKEPFTILTDHKNLLYIENARRLGPRQARWALFFSRFDFHLSYIPGTKNVKADVLSRIHSSEKRPEESLETILPHERILATSTFKNLDKHLHSQRRIPKDLVVPDNKLFVPSKIVPEVLSWGHSSKSAGHPGFKKTTDLIRRNFWWPRMSQDILEFTRACPTCAQSKTLRQKPQGFLLPLPVPDRPWSHISMDFIVELPKSRGMNTILVVVDRFSKMGKRVGVLKPAATPSNNMSNINPGETSGSG
ncbi:GDP-D-glucose phosphorylase 1 isoform X2 [Ascaphus truei]|uniref:GDP-D-glucose phosphorylase 1 isoform X2 n=1 Tax=Ascaphus truei TaxID=8439 RepID=UPI003F5A7127